MSLPFGSGVEFKRRWRTLRGRWRREWLPRLSRWWDGRGRFLALLVCLYGFAVVCFARGWLAPAGTGDLNRILPLLLTAGVFLVSIPGVYLVNRHFEFRGEQYDRLEEYWALQSSFVEYQRAFWELTRAVSRTYEVDPQAGRDYQDLVTDFDMLEDSPSDFSALLFVRNLWEAGQEYWQIDRPEIRERTIAPWYLDHLHDVVGDLSAVWARQKHYGPILDGLGISIPDGVSVRSYRLVRGPWVIRIGKHRIVQANDGDHETIGFWEDRFDEAFQLLEEMKTHAQYLFGGPPAIIKVLLGQLTLLTGVAVIVPLGVLALEIPGWIETRLTYFAILGFFTSLFLIGAILYQEVLESSVVRERRGLEEE